MARTIIQIYLVKDFVKRLNDRFQTVYIPKSGALLTHFKTLTATKKADGRLTLPPWNAGKPAHDENGDPLEIFILAEVLRGRPVYNSTFHFELFAPDFKQGRLLGYKTDPQPNLTMETVV